MKYLFSNVMRLTSRFMPEELLNTKFPTILKQLKKSIRKRKDRNKVKTNRKLSSIKKIQSCKDYEVKLYFSINFSGTAKKRQKHRLSLCKNFIESNTTRKHLKRFKKRKKLKIMRNYMIKHTTKMKKARRKADFMEIKKVSSCFLD